MLKIIWILLFTISATAACHGGYCHRRRKRSNDGADDCSTGDFMKKLVKKYMSYREEVWAECTKTAINAAKKHDKDIIARINNDEVLNKLHLDNGMNPEERQEFVDSSQICQDRHIVCVYLSECIKAPELFIRGFSKIKFSTPKTGAKMTSTNEPHKHNNDVQDPKRDASVLHSPRLKNKNSEDSSDVGERNNLAKDDGSNFIANHKRYNGDGSRSSDGNLYKKTVYGSSSYGYGSSSFGYDHRSNGVPNNRAQGVGSSSSALMNRDHENASSDSGYSSINVQNDNIDSDGDESSPDVVMKKGRNVYGGSSSNVVNKRIQNNDINSESDESSPNVAMKQDRNVYGGSSSNVVNKRIQNNDINSESDESSPNVAMKQDRNVYGGSSSNVVNKRIQNNDIDSESDKSSPDVVMKRGRNVYGGSSSNVVNKRIQNNDINSESDESSPNVAMKQDRNVYGGSSSNVVVNTVRRRVYNSSAVVRRRFFQRQRVWHASSS